MGGAMFSRGDFVRVGDDIGVVVTLEYEQGTPEEHIGVWYGESNEEGIPRYRTVPVEYCQKVTALEVYH